jgi:hypothetical protein
MKHSTSFFGLFSIFFEKIVRELCAASFFIFLFFFVFFCPFCDRRTITAASSSLLKLDECAQDDG